MADSGSAGVGDAGHVVTAFIEAIERRDLDAALALVHDDIEYDNVPMPTVHGVTDVRNFLAPFVTGADEVQWRVHRQLANADTVLNERTDRFRFGDNWIEVPVAGVWQVRDGRISLWRDYFDLQAFTGGDQQQAAGS